MQRMLKIGKIGTILFMVAGYLLTVIPSLIGIVNIGVLLPNLGFMLGIIYLICRESRRLRKKKWFLVVDKMFVILFCIGIAVLLIVSLIMGFGFARYDDGAVDVVVVPGAKVNGDYPSLMLRGRLDKAYDLLLAHPEASCVVSGGQGADETYTEAYVMKKYLTDKGIAPERIYEENQAVNTKQNFVYAKAMIDEYALGNAVTVTTDYYHSYRCTLYAKRAGLLQTSVSPCRTRIELLPSYWLREIFAVFKAWLTA